MFESIFLIIVVTGLISAFGVIIKSKEEKNSILFSLFFLVFPFIFIHNKWLQLGSENTLALTGYLLLLAYNGVLLFIIFPTKSQSQDRNEEDTLAKYFVASVFFIMSILPVEIIGRDFGWWTREKEQQVWNANAFYETLTKNPWNQILFSHAIIIIIVAFSWLPIYIHGLDMLKNRIKIEEKRNKTIIYSFFPILTGLLYGLVISLILIFLQNFY